MSEQTRAKKSVFKKWWFWAIIIVVVVVIIAVSSSMAGGESGGGKTPAKNYINDTVTAGKISAKVTQVEDTKQIGTAFLGSTTEDNFILIYITITHTGSSEVSLTSSSFELYKGTAKYSTHTAGLYLENGFWVLLEIGAGLTKSTIVVFETPSEHTADEYELKISQSIYSARVVLKISSNFT